MTSPEPSMKPCSKHSVITETAYYESKLIERDGYTHIVQQVMGRINIQLGNTQDTEFQLLEASKIAEFQIKVINDKITLEGISPEAGKRLQVEKNRLSGFIMDNLELSKCLNN